MKIHALVTATLVCFGLLPACSSGPAMNPNAAAKGARINKIVDDYFELYLRLDPLFASSIGDHRFDDQLAITLSAEHRKAEEELTENSLNEVKALGCDGLNYQDNLTCETFTRDMSTELQLQRADLDYLMPINQFDSFFSNFAEVASGSSYVTFESESDYDNFLKRLNLFPEQVDAAIANMKFGLKKNVTTPQVLVKKALKQIRDLLPKKIEDSVFYKPVAKGNSSLNVEDRERIEAEYKETIQKKIYPAYQRLERFVAREYLPKARKTHGLYALPGGKEYYAALSKFHTTTDLNPEQIHQLGLSEVSRIRTQFEDVKNQMGFKGSNKDFFTSIRKDPKLFPFHTSQEVLDAYQAIYERVLKQIPDHFHLLPKAKFEIREVEKFKAENASEAYQNASPDGMRPGIFWVPIPDATKYGKKDMESLFLHEAIPGHHFQISIQQETDLPRYRRFNGNNAYVEGWALYCEGLGKDLGIYTDPYQWIGRLENDMHRAIRLVVDTGIHSQGWTREKAIRYSLDNEPGDEAGIISEIERYMAIPGQALSYKLGEIKILELKAKAKARLLKKYSDRDFHDEILKDGPLPLSVLDEKISEWIAVRAAH